MSWQQSQQRLPRILAETDSGEAGSSSASTAATTAAASSSASSSSSSRQMGPPSQSLPSLNFRQLAPLRSPNLPSSTHSSNYFSQQRHRSTSESIANDALRTLRHGLPPPPNLPEPPNNLLHSSTKRGETLPPLSGSITHSTSSGSLLSEHSSSGRSSKSSSASHYYHPYQQQQHPSQHPQHLQHQQLPHHQSSPVSSYYRSSSTTLAPTSPTAAPTINYSGLPFSRPRPSSSHDAQSFSPSPPSNNTFDRSIDRSRESSSTMDREDPSSPRKLAKSHVPSACLNCKRAHLACDVNRPCRRCINLGKTDTCIDVQHKKRGRPRLRDREAAAAAAAAAAAVTTNLPDQRIPSGMPGQRMRESVSSVSTTSTMKHSPRSEPTTFFSGDSGMIPSPTRASRLPPPAHQRGRSISSSASLWSHQTPSGGVGVAHASSDFGADTSSPTVSLILSTGLQCARCSVESYALLGYSPSDLIERSLFELVHPSETLRLEQLWLSLIEPVGVKSQVVPADAETVMTISPAILMAPAPGTVYMQETMRLRQRSGIYDFYSIRLHLGGGFGADLYQPSTLDRAYIVASLLKLGNDATHPDPNVLREARWYPGSDPKHFTTPQSSSMQGGGAGSARGLGGSSAGAGGYSVESGNNVSYHSAAPSRYDWQRLDKDGRSAPAPISQPPPPPPYSRSAYHHPQSAPHYDADSRLHNDRSSSYVSRKVDTPSKPQTTSIPYSYSSGGERGSILC